MCRPGSAPPRPCRPSSNKPRASLPPYPLLTRPLSDHAGRPVPLCSKSLQGHTQQDRVSVAETTTGQLRTANRANPATTRPVACPIVLSGPQNPIGQRTADKLPRTKLCNNTITRRKQQKASQAAPLLASSTLAPLPPCYGCPVSDCLLAQSDTYKTT